MKKKILLLTMMLSVGMFAGCNQTDDQNNAKQTQGEVSEEKTEKDTEQKDAQMQETESESEASEAQTETDKLQQENVSEETFSFADVADKEFEFSSGAGGWYTVLYINEDGTFEGNFHDSELGVTGTDYPNGTIYYSDFKGTFTEPKKVDDTTYAFEIASIEYPCGFGEEVKDGYLYVYGTAYGLDGAKELYMYLPGAKIADLPEAYRSWVGYYDIESMEETELSFYGLYNVKEEAGFSSYDKISDAEWMEYEIALTEDTVAELEEKLQNASTQMEMNDISYQIYMAWDDTLNLIWGVLKDNLDEEKMKKLTEEERNWIAEKEEAVKLAGEEAEGGSMQPLLESDKAAELTKERVYELMEYLK